MFTVVNVLGNTFGAFARTPNSHANVPVDVVGTRPVSLDTVFDITASLGDQSRSAQIRLTP
jgi:hypothetical protein